jgi:TatD DNase family protein
MKGFSDIHCHALNARYPQAIVNLSPATAAQSLNNSTHPYFSCGIHPWDVHTATEHHKALLRELAGHSRIVAIGECGFDKNAQASPAEQAALFALHIALAEAVGKPLIVHLTGYYPAFFQLLAQHKPTQPCIIHGFRGKPGLAKQLLQAGVYLSYGAHYNPQSVLATPIHRLCVETDCAPQTIEQVYAGICRLKNCRPEDITAPEMLFGI